MAWAAAWLLKLTQTIVLWGVAQPLGHRFVVGPTWGWVLLFYALLAVAAVAVTTSRRQPATTETGRIWRCGAWWLLAAWFIPGWWITGFATREANLEAEVLAVGHGLAVVLQLPDGQTLVYDCGRLGDPTVGRRIIAPALWSRGVNRIDTVFLSHADQDHYDGLPDLLDRFSITEVRLPPGFAGPNNPLAVELIDLLGKRGINVRPITAPARWQSAGVQFAVSHPPDGWQPDTSDNARSLVLDVAYRGRHLLLTGDLEQPGLDLVVSSPRPDPAPDAFLAPHHGGKSSNPDWLYDWANPRAVIVSQRLAIRPLWRCAGRSRGTGHTGPSHVAPGVDPLAVGRRRHRFQRIRRANCRSRSRLRSPTYDQARMVVDHATPRDGHRRGRRETSERAWFIGSEHWLCTWGTYLSGSSGDRVRGLGVVGTSTHDERRRRAI